MELADNMFIINSLQWWNIYEIPSLTVGVRYPCARPDKV